jgi:uncharacterized membrane protein YfcA
MLAMFGICIITGSWGTLVGGQGLVTIPTLILLGLPPHTAIGTNLMGMTGVAGAGWYKFHKKRMVNYKIGFMIGLPTAVGAILGANLVFHINEEMLRRIIAILTVLILVFIVVVKPTMGIEKASHDVKRYEYLSGTVISLFLGIYGGFYGPGTATFLSYILIVLFRQTFLESAATVKIAVLSVTTLAALIFAINGAVDYYLASAMFIGGFIGSYIGAHYSDRIGNVWVKRLFIVVVLLMATKMIW